jgi:hypothetical protein
MTDIVNRSPAPPRTRATNFSTLFVASRFRAN